MPRGSEYRQTGIGDCGHVVNTWPQVTDLAGRNPRVNCEECLREQFKIDPSATFFYVHLVDPPKPKLRKPRQTNKSLYLTQDEALF